METMCPRNDGIAAGLQVPPHSLRGLTRNTSNSLAQARLHLAGAIIPDTGAIFSLANCLPAPAPAHISWELNQDESGETITNDAGLVGQIARLPPFPANSRLLTFRISTAKPARGYPIDILPEKIEKECAEHCNLYEACHAILRQTLSSPRHRARIVTTA